MLTFSEAGFTRWEQFLSWIIPPNKRDHYEVINLKFFSTVTVSAEMKMTLDGQYEQIERRDYHEGGKVALEDIMMWEVV